MVDKVDDKAADKVATRENPDKGKEKEIVILKAENGLWYAKFKNGGQVPEILRGVWTHYDELLGKINYYLQNREKLLRKAKTEQMRRARAAKRNKKKEEISNEDDSS